MRKKPLSMHSEPEHHTWTDEELTELEDESTWDWTSAGTHSPASTSVIVHMTLNREDFRRIARSANSEGMKLIDFMRQAALERAESSGNETGSGTRSAD
jgi:hypothetical protein